MRTAILWGLLDLASPGGVTGAAMVAISVAMARGEAPRPVRARCEDDDDA